MAIIVDVETVSMDGADAFVQPDKRLTDPAKIAASIAERAQKAALFPWTTRIIALGTCEETDDVERVTLCNSEAAEARALKEFAARIEDGQGRIVPLVTFNGLGYDLPVLMARARLLRVRFPELSIDRYRSPHPDLLKILTFNWADKDWSRSLHWFARRFGLDVGDEIKGGDVAQLYADENWPAIEAHCASDVRLTRQLGELLGVLRARQGWVS